MMPTDCAQLKWSIESCAVPSWNDEDGVMTTAKAGRYATTPECDGPDPVHSIHGPASARLSAFRASHRISVRSCDAE